MSLVIAKAYELDNCNPSLFATKDIASEWLHNVTSGGYKARIDKDYAYRIVV